MLFLPHFDRSARCVKGDVPGQDRVAHAGHGRGGDVRVGGVEVCVDECDGSLEFLHRFADGGNVVVFRANFSDNAVGKGFCDGARGGAKL